MLRLLSTAYFLLFILVSSIYAQQTLTVPDPNGSGNNVVEVVSTDPDTGEATTIILSTIAPDAPAAPAAPTQVPNPADDPGAQQGPVGAPPNTATLNGPAPLIYTYTTQGAVFTATFAPTYQQPNAAPPLSTGSIWSFQEYTKQFGGAAAAATRGAANSLTTSRSSAWIWTAACGILAVAAGGALFI